MPHLLFLILLWLDFGTHHGAEENPRGHGEVLLIFIIQTLVTYGPAHDRAGRRGPTNLYGFVRIVEFREIEVFAIAQWRFCYEIYFFRRFRRSTAGI